MGFLFFLLCKITRRHTELPLETCREMRQSVEARKQRDLRNVVLTFTDHLLAAEANLESDNAKATEYLNVVRRRAQLADKGSITLADIQLEKQCELCGEGVRFQDIQRWGIAKDLLAKMGEKIPTRSAGGIEWDTKANNDPSKYGYKAGKHELLPMPFKEIQMNSALKQNPGWD